MFKYPLFFWGGGVFEHFEDFSSVVEKIGNLNIYNSLTTKPTASAYEDHVISKAPEQTLR